jgi:hypothetical protein
MFETGWKFNYFLLFEEFLDIAMHLTLPIGCKVDCQKISLIYLINLGFQLLLFKNFSHGSLCCNLQCD